MSSGSVIARAYTAGDAIPVEGVTILVTRHLPDGRNALLGLRMTDANGQSAPVEVETPDKALSETPTGQVSWANCDVVADHPDYERIVVENVQVFPGTVTLQEFALVPLEERPDLWGKTEVFEVTPQEL